MNHTYLRYECADSFGVVVSTGSSRVPHSHSHLGRTTTTTTTANAAAHTHSLLWAVTGSSVTAYCERTGLPTLRLAHREQLSGGVGTGRALNASECACLDVLNVETEADNEPQRRKSPSSTAIRVATGWIDGAVRVFDVTKSDLALSSSSSSSSTTNGLGLAHSLLFDDDGDDDDEERSRRLSDQNREFVKREPLTLNGHSSPVRALRFEKTAASSSTTTSSSSLSTSAATNKNRLASGATDGSVVVWDVVEEVGLFRLVGHKGGMAGGNGGGGGGITDLAFVSTSALVDGLITASVDGLVKVWDLTLQCCVQTLVNHPGPVHGMDCRNLGSSSRRRRRRAWKERINDGDGSSDEDDKERWRLVTGSVDGFVRIWSVQSPGPNRRGPHPSPKASLHGAEFIPAANNELNIVTADAGDMTDNYEKDACCVYLGTVSPPPNAASAHYHQRVECVRWYQNRYLGVLRWDSKHVDIYRVKSPDEAAKTRQRRLRRRREKHNKKRQEADGGGSGADDRSGVASTMGSNKKRGLLDDPDSSDDDGKHNANLATSEDWVDPERVRASDELEYLTTVIASHKVRSFVFVRKRTSSPRSLLRVVCALATNSMETYEVVRSRKDATQKHQPWDAVTAEKLPIVDASGHPTGIRAVALSSDDSLACTVSKNVTMVWNVHSRRCIHSFSSSTFTHQRRRDRTSDAAPSSIYGLCAAFLPGNSHVVVGTREGHLLLLDIHAGEIVDFQEKAHAGAIWSVDVARSGGASSSISIVTGSADHAVKFWVVEADSESDYDDEIEGRGASSAERPVLVHTRTLELKDDVVAARYSYAVDASKRLVFVATLDNTVKVFFDDSLKLFLNLYGHTLPVLAVDSSDDGAILATGGADKTVKIWGLDFGDTHRTMHGHEDSITDLRFVRRTHNFFTSSKDFSVRYWDGDRFEQILVLNGHGAEVNCLAVSRTGAFVLSGGMDRQVRVWERTKDIVFVEEERERQMEQIFERLGGREATTVSILERKDDESDDENADDGNQPQSEAAVQHNVLSVAAGDRLLEGLERADQELKDIIAWKKANGPSKTKQPNPMMLGLEPALYILWLLRTIKSAELEQSLLVLPLTHIERLIYYCTVLLRQGRGTELCAKVSVFLVKVHQNQIAVSGSMATPLRELRRLVQLRLAETRDVVGYNLAALKLVARIAQEKKKESLPWSESQATASADIWVGMGLGSEVAAALEGKSKSKRHR